MIRNKKDLDFFLHKDALSMGFRFNSSFAKIKTFLSNPIWRFLVILRYTEYYYNVHKVPLYYLFLIYFRKISLKLGFSIPLNVCAEGLSLPHYGTVVINSKAKIGANCRIHVCVNIGASFGKGAPHIGNDVYIGPGAKLYGDIKIGNGAYVSANAAVGKSFDQDNIIIGGVPAKILKISEEVWWVRNQINLNV